MPQSQPKQIKMVFPLKNFGESPQTPPHVTTCIEAMRGFGRIQTTRNFQPSQAWKIHAGEIAIAVGGKGEAVAFRVGKEYQITPALAADPEYQTKWATNEKHSAQYLQELSQQNPRNLWAMEMEPLGDWVKGEIKPFPNQLEKTHWAQHIPAPTQGYEVSSHGDKRFSALNARLSDGRSIEEAYQLDVKGYRSKGNDWRLGKGKPPLEPMTPDQAYLEYRSLWRQWSIENQEAFEELVELSKGKILTDKFASSPISQAHALCDLANEARAPQQIKHYALISQKEGQVGSAARLGLMEEIKAKTERTNPEDKFSVVEIDAKYRHRRRSRDTKVGTNSLAPACPEKITSLKPQQIFVFGSNTQGFHGAGSAKDAMQWGARYGQANGLQGQTYAIVTKDLTKPKAEQSRSIPLGEIDRQITHLCEFAEAHPEKEFLVTKIGCGRAGYTDSEVGKLWQARTIPPNIHLPQVFIDLIGTAAEESKETPLRQKTKNPLADLKPLNPNVALPMKKDIAMAAMSTQFIGQSAAPEHTPSSTRNYERKWAEIGLSNTGVYSPNDIVMVSGSGPWRGVTQQQIQQTFQRHYKPLLETVVKAGATVVVGNAQGTDQLVQTYLNTQGYRLTPQPEGFMKAEQTTQEAKTETPTLTNQKLDTQLRELGFSRFKPNENTIQYDLSTHNDGDGLESFRFDKNSRSWSHFSRPDDDGAPIAYTAISKSEVKNRFNELAEWRSECAKSGEISLKNWEAPSPAAEPSLLDKLQSFMSESRRRDRSIRLFLEPETANALGIGLDSFGDIKGLDHTTFENKGWEMQEAGYICPLTNRELKEDTLLLEININQNEPQPPIDFSKPPIVLACDGACSMQHDKNRYPGGWGAVIQYPDGSEIELSNYNLRTTNNRMEATALIEGIKELHSNNEEALQFADHPIHVIADSQYVISVASGKKQAEANLDLWEEYQEVTTERIQSFEWTRGHSGHPLNERADKLAAKQRDIAKGILESQNQGKEPTTANLSKSPQKYPVYLSLVNDEVKIHSDWDSCKEAVHKQSGAKYQKCKDEQAVQTLLETWGKPLAVRPTASPESTEELSQQLLRAVQTSYEQTGSFKEPVKIPVGDQWTASVRSSGEVTIRNESKRTMLVGNFLNNEIQVPLSKENAKQFKQIRSTPKVEATQPNTDMKGFDLD